MKKVSIITCGLYVALSFIFYSSPVIAEEKYGVVDYQEILTKCDVGKKNVEILKKMDSDNFKSLKEQDAALRKRKEDLDKQKKILTEAAFQEKEMDLRKQARDLEMKAKDAADEMKAKEQEMLNKLSPELEKAIKTIGERGKYTMLVDSRAPAWFRPSINLTQEVIEELNKTYKPKK